jgi:hypothetical protein
MDERKLGELFRAAVPDAPPPSFDHTDIATESNRQRVRRRNALLGGSALGVALLAGAAVLGVALWKGTEAGDATSTANGPFVASGSGNGGAVPNEVPNEDAERSAGGSASDNSFPPEAPKQGGPLSGNAGPTGPGSTPSGCEKADLELAAALAGELQAAVNDMLPADVPCPPNSRGAAFRVDGGIVSVIVTPKDAQLPSPVAGQPEGTAVRPATASDGRHVVLVSEPAVGSTDPPLETRLQDIANTVAGRI